MGIKNLNRFLFDHCSKKSICKIHLSELAGKTLVIDTSIYLYKFSYEDSLIENMYLFVSILKHYKIRPLFIFDGKPPPEKRDLLQRRRMEKKDAENKYMKLKELKSIIKEEIKSAMADQHPPVEHYLGLLADFTEKYTDDVYDFKNLATAMEQYAKELRQRVADFS